MKRAPANAVARFLSLALVSALALGATTPVTRLTIDLLGNGHTATVQLQSRRDAVVVIVAFSDPSLAPERFRFAVDPEREDAVCRLPVHLVAESFEGQRGFRIVDGACDSIHFRWNPRKRRLEWWRL